MNDITRDYANSSSGPALAHAPQVPGDRVVAESARYVGEAARYVGPQYTAAQGHNPQPGTQNTTLGAGGLSIPHANLHGRPERPHAPMDFGLALSALKHGKRIRRKCWNGHNWVAHSNHLSELLANEEGFPQPPIVSDSDAWSVEAERPCLVLKTHARIAAWAPLLHDLLAEDWIVV